MAQHLQREIEKLKKMILSLSAVVEESVQRAVQAVIERNSKVASQLIEGDSVIDQMELDVEEECLKILALYQPVANDLRFVIAVLKINNDLERVGDIANHIAERALSLSNQQSVGIPFELRRMADRAQSMFRSSLDSLVNMDSNLARGVCASDDEIDEMNRQAFIRVQDAIRKDPENVDYLIQLLSVSRYLERIADYATNVAEDVIYMTEGRIIRHKKEAIPPPKIRQVGRPDAG
jgi:phosphate transport system protein